MESTIEIYLIICIFILTIVFGVREILKDQSLSFEKRILWIVLLVLFNILTVVIYLIIRLFKKEQQSS